MRRCKAACGWMRRGVFLWLSLVAVLPRGASARLDTPWQVPPSDLDPYLTFSEKQLVRRCTTSTAVCDDMEMGIYAVMGCEDSERGGTSTFCTVSSSTASPPPLTVIGRGFGNSDVRMWVGESECEKVTVQNYTSGPAPTYYLQLLCEGWSMSTRFSELISVESRWGDNVTGPAGVHFGPPVLDLLKFNDTESCSDTGADSSLHVTCWDDATLTFTGRYFPTLSEDYTSTFLQSEAPNDPPVTDALGVQLFASDGSRSGPPCVNVRTYFSDQGTFVECNLIVRRTGFPRKYDAPGTYGVKLWWGTLWATGNVTVTIPDNIGELRTVSCGDYTFPEYGGPESLQDDGDHHISMAADNTYISSVPVRCSQGIDEVIYADCCTPDGAGVTHSDCAYSGTYTRASKFCTDKNLRLCTKAELEGGMAASATTGCSTAIRRSWVIDEGCESQGSCRFSRPFVIRGKWYTEDITDFDITIYAVDSAQYTGVGNWSCEVISLAFVPDPLSAEELQHEITCEPRYLSRSGRYGVSLRVAGKLYPIAGKFLYHMEPAVHRITGCYDIGLSTTRCPSNSQSNIVHIHGTNLDAVTDVSFGGKFCAMNLTNATGMYPSVVAATEILCVMEGDMTGISSTATLHVGDDTFVSDRRISASWVTRPRVDVTSCLLPGGVCPTEGGHLVVWGVGLDTVVWMTPGSTDYSTGTFGTSPKLWIGNVECDNLVVLNGSVAECRDYSIRGRYSELLHQADPSITITMQIGDEVDPTGAQQVFRRVPYISSIAGCDNYCDVRSHQPITVIGGNFTASDEIYVHIGGVRCIDQVYVDSTTVICKEYVQDMTLHEHRVQLQMNGEWSVERPKVKLIVLCNGENGLECSGHGRCTHHAVCICDRSSHTGFWQGETCSDCLPGYWGPSCQSGCMCPEATGLCDHGVNGTGYCASCQTNYSGILCDPCPGTAQMMTCGLHGTCNDTVSGDGMCVCDGHYDPLQACFECDENYYGTECQHRCPGGAHCSGHGVCSNGLGGTGQCACQEAWGGDACDSMCAGGAANTCFGHGACDQLRGVCSCFFDAQQGYWAEPACSTCARGWTSTTCTETCAVADDGLECSGHGYCGEKGCVCSDGFCSFDCSRTATECSLAVCLTDALWGNEQTCKNGICGCDCPTHGGKVCAGSGICDSGEYGTGRCNCFVGRSGRACQHDCSSCSLVGGACDNSGVCNCRAGFGGLNCDRECPGALNGVPCGGSSHGVCSDGPSGTGLCACLAGYAGEECLTQCSGGVDNPCSGHGACSKVDGTCTCTYDPLEGYWDGVKCDVCMEPFLLPSCNETCPGFLPQSSASCSGHGSCDASSRTCVCQVEKAGSWAGVRCDQCSAGFYGLSCGQECPGGACNPCNGHGVCDDGVNGDGKCFCTRSDEDGHWAGTTCSQCVTDYYGATCTSRCPGMGTPDGICRGRGTCRDGRTGSGTCTCMVPDQKWTGFDCNECQAGYFGALCNKGCPSVNSFICSGHGACADGTGGFGNCTCMDGWVDSACSSSCPGLGTPEGICNNHGECIAGTGRVRALCLCHTDTVRGHWEAPGCANCAQGYFGPSCAQRCPGTGSPCSGHGVLPTCHPVTGECKCLSGWAGGGCDVECAGGSVTPCSLHGTCDPVSGKCACHSSPVLGYWAGATCSECHPHYTSPATGCTRACPLQAPCEGCSAQACSGYGQCTPSLTGPGAVCIMCSDQTTTRCGDACEISGDIECQRYMCVGARWGLQCDQLCPGATPAKPLPCNSNGYCDEGKAGSGRCICDQGYVGGACQLRCPDCTAGKGECASDGTCTCLPGFGGTLCELECPGGFRSPCGMYDSATQVYESHGRCNDGSTGDVACTCFVGWRGRDCNTRCLGVLPDGTPCNGNGDCLQFNPRCHCQQDPLLGYWQGDACTACSPGYVGENCTAICLQGTTSGKECRCHSGYFGAECSTECSGKLQRGSTVEYCNGHGTCDDGNTGTGDCMCDAEYYGSSCQTYCVVSTTCQEYLSQAVICGPSGCECIRNATHGYWQGSNCEQCRRGYWGPSCLLMCDCNQNEYSCDQQTGACNCYSDTTNGFYSGTYCQSCKSGYIGSHCQTVDVKISRPSVPASTAPPDTIFRNQQSAFMLVDEDKHYVVVATTPPAVFNTSGTSPIYSPSLTKPLVIITGTVTGGAVRTHTVELLVQEGEIVDMFVFHRANLTFKSKVNVVLPVQALRDELSVQGHSINTLSREYGLLRRHWESLQQASPVPTFGILKQTASVGGLWVLALQLAKQIKLRIVSTASGRASTLHEQLLTNFDTYHDMFILGGTNLVISGSLAGIFDATALELDSATGVVRSAVSFSSLPQLAPLHRSILGAPYRIRYETMQRNGQFWYIALRHKTSLLVIKLDSTRIFDVPPQANDIDCAASRLCTTVLNNGDNWAVNKMVIDLAAAEGYITVIRDTTDPSVPSQLFRFKLDTVEVSGSTELAFFAGQAEVAQDIAVIPGSSSVVTLPRTGFVRLITLNSYFVERLIPDVADMRGGTLVTVVGKGFRGGSVVGTQPLCRIDGKLAEVTSYNQTTMVCRAEETERVTDCDGETVDVSFEGPDRFTSNDNAKLRRVFSATPELSIPTKGITEGDTLVTIKGYGFDYGGHLSCEFFDDTFSVSAPAIYKKSTELQCIQPKWPRPSKKGLSYIRLAQDGQIPSLVKIPYDVVGTIANLQLIDKTAVDASSAFKVASEDITVFPPVEIRSLDSEGQLIAPLLTVPLIVTPNKDVHCVGRSGSITLQLEHTTQANLVHIISGMPYVPLGTGIAKVFDGLYLRKPKAARCAVVFEVYSALPGLAINDGTVFVTSQAFEVTAGRPTRLQLLDQPLPEFEEGASLSPSPTLQLLDSAGNVVSAPNVLLKAEVIMDVSTSVLNPNITVTPKVEYFRTNPFTGLFECGCKRMSIPSPLFGVSYRIHFEPVGGAEGVASITTDAMMRSNCPMGFYALIYTPFCRACPEGGVCDGTWVIRLSDGFWRWQGSNYSLLPELDADQRAVALEIYTKLYACNPASACGLGIGVPTEDVICGDGHDPTANLCQNCLETYAFSGTSCRKCNGSSVTLLLSLLIVAAAVIVIGSVVFVTYIDNIKGVRSDAFVEMKQVLSWLQTVSVSSQGSLDHSWPATFAFYEVVRKSFNLHSEIGVFNCLVQTSYYQKWLMVMLLPFITTVVFWIIAVVLQVLDLMKEREGAVTEKSTTLDTDITFFMDDDFDAIAPVGMKQKTKHLVTDLVGFLVQGTAVENRNEEEAAVASKPDCPLERGFSLPIYPDLYKGTHSELLATVTKPPPTDVSLMPYGPGLTFVPPVFAFTSEVTEIPFSVVGNVLGHHRVTYKVSGTDKRYYPTPKPSEVTIFDEWRTGVHDKVISTLVVFFFFCLPIFVEVMAGLIPCQQIGPNGDYFLKADPLIECYTPKYWSYMVGNILVCLIYCIFFPGITVYYTYCHRHHLENATVRVKLGFLFRGMKPKQWFWEYVVMVRKLVITLICSLSTDLWSRLYAVQWVLGVFLGVTVYIQPYVAKANNVTEILLLAQHIIAMNVALIYFTDGLHKGVIDFAGGVVVAVNIATVLMLIFAFIWIWKMNFVLKNRHKRFHRVMIGREDDAFEKEENTTWAVFIRSLLRKYAPRLLPCFGVSKRAVMRSQIFTKMRVGGGAVTLAAAALPVRERFILERAFENKRLVEPTPNDGPAPPVPEEEISEVAFKEMQARVVQEAPKDLAVPDNVESAEGSVHRSSASGSSATEPMMHGGRPISAGSRWQRGSFADSSLRSDSVISATSPLRVQMSSNYMSALEGSEAEVGVSPRQKRPTVRSAMTRRSEIGLQLAQPQATPKRRSFALMSVTFSHTQRGSVSEQPRQE